MKKYDKTFQYFKLNILIVNYRLAVYKNLKIIICGFIVNNITNFNKIVKIFYQK